MNVWQKYLGMAALIVLCNDCLGRPPAQHEQLVSLPVMPTLMRPGSFAPDIKPTANQLRNTAGFGSSLDNRDTERRQQADSRFSWGIVGFGLGFNKRF